MVVTTDAASTWACSLCISANSCETRSARPIATPACDRRPSPRFFLITGSALPSHAPSHAPPILPPDLPMMYAMPIAPREGIAAKFRCAPARKKKRIKRRGMRERSCSFTLTTRLCFDVLASTNPIPMLTRIRERWNMDARPAPIRMKPKVSAGMLLFESSFRISQE